MKLVDTRDLKSLERNLVPVQVRPWAPLEINKFENFSLWCRLRWTIHITNIEWKNLDISVFDTDSEKIENLNNGICPIDDIEVHKYLKKYRKKIRFFNTIDSFKNKDICIIATPNKL